MSNIKRYIEFITELNAQTLRDAADKADGYGQSELATKLRDHVYLSQDLEKKRRAKEERKLHQELLSKKAKKNLISRLINEYSFDFYFNTVSVDGYTETVKKVYQIRIDDFDRQGYGIFWFFPYSSELTHDIVEPQFIGNVTILLAISISADENDTFIREVHDSRSKFANRKSAIKFLHFLKKLYILENPKAMKRATYKLNKLEVPENVPGEGGAWFNYINEDFGGWDNFEKRYKQNIRHFYDTHS